MLPHRNQTIHQSRKAATAFDITHGNFLPPKWCGWITLPVRDCDQAVNTSRGRVRVRTGIIAINYARVPLRRPRFGRARHLGARRRRLPVHRSQTRSPRRGHRPRHPTLARRKDVVGELRPRSPCSELTQSRSSPRRSRPAPAQTARCATCAAGVCVHPQSPRRCRLGTLPQLTNGGLPETA